MCAAGLGSSVAYRTDLLLDDGRQQRYAEAPRRCHPQALMPRLLMPSLAVTSRLRDRTWATSIGTFSWVEWRRLAKPSPLMDDEMAGRLVFDTKHSLDSPSVQKVADALSGLLDVAQAPLGVRCYFVDLPPDMETSSTLVEDDLQGELEAGRWYAAAHHMPDFVFVGNEIPEWALDRLDVALRHDDVFAAAAVLFVSHLEYSFHGGDVDMVLSAEDADRVERSLIDKIRVEESFLNCFKALETLLGGEPPKDRRGLRDRLQQRGLDPDAMDGFEGHKESVLERVRRLHATRGPRSAHGYHDRPPDQRVSFFDLMDAQYQVAQLIRKRIHALMSTAPP